MPLFPLRSCKDRGEEVCLGLKTKPLWMERVACKMLSTLHFFKLLSLIDLSILRDSNDLLLLLKRRSFQMCAAIGICYYLQRSKLVWS